MEVAVRRCSTVLIWAMIPGFSRFFFFTFNFFFFFLLLLLSRRLPVFSLPEGWMKDGGPLTIPNQTL